MKNLFVLAVFILTSFSFAQQLPLKIGNQWDYDVSVVPGGTDYAAIAVDTMILNNKTYYKIERKNAYTGELITTTYDRLEGDSAYYRFVNNHDSLIINFNWPIGYTEIIPQDTCQDFYRLASIGTRDIWGFNTASYQFQIGQLCPGTQDTAWVLFSPEIIRMFGCYWADDGRLVGALIDSIPYGTLYPLPVELSAFSASLDDNNVILHWTTASELNNKGFEILRAINNSQSLKPIAFVEGHGTVTRPQQYVFKDASLKPGIYQYKLRQIDFDNTFTYSNPIEVKVNLVHGFTLSQNFPNPFNPATVIHYKIDNKQFITLKVFNVLGKEVATLINEEKPAGEYDVEFNGANLPSGIYFYQLKTNDYIATKKMMLLK